jgi:hypothetical protein
LSWRAYSKVVMLKFAGQIKAAGHIKNLRKIPDIAIPISWLLSVNSKEKPLHVISPCA